MHPPKNPHGGSLLGGCLRFTGGLFLSILGLFVRLGLFVLFSLGLFVLFMIPPNSILL
jgi:hypothetical protein